MKQLKTAIPNFVTCLNLITGCIGIVFTLTHLYYCAGFFVGIAAFFDFFDGMLARLLKVTSPIGKELDSLADLISFGVVPGLVIFQLLSISFNDYAIPVYQRPLEHILLEMSAMLIPAFSALRLAKFNLDERQSEHFIGLPTPANAILITSLPLTLRYDMGLHILQHSGTVTATRFTFLLDFANILMHPATLIVLTLVLSFLLISEIRLFSLKFKNFTFQDNAIRFIFLGLAAFCYLVFAIIFHYFYFPIFIIIILYVILSLFNKGGYKENNTIIK